MRLAQIARKVGMTPTDIRRFLEDQFEVNIGKEPNYKLDEAQVEAVLTEFPIPEEIKVAPKAVITEVVEEILPSSEVVEELTATEVTEISEPVVKLKEEVAEVALKEVENEVKTITETEIEEAAEVIEEVIDTPAAKDLKNIAEIQYDETEGEVSTEPESTEGFKEVPVDRDADLIQAPKVKLDGLKILGKIDLPQSKKELEIAAAAAEEKPESDDSVIAALDAAMQSQAQDIKSGVVKQEEAKAVKEHAVVKEETLSEYKDKRGIYHFSAKQRQNREKSLARIATKAKLELEKEKKKRFYEERVKANQAAPSIKANKVKEKKTKATIAKKEQKQKEAPKGLWAKFVSWLND